MSRRNEWKVFLCLLFSSEPLSLYAIAKKTNLSTSSVHRAVKNLYENGLTVMLDGKFALQPMFYEKKFWIELEDKLEPLIQHIYDYSIGEPDIIESLYYILRYIRDVKKK